MHQDVLVMILAGGEGSRLQPLTLHRAKPAVPFGGKYRIIDLVLSNFVNSGFYKIKVLTQYKSESLDTHISRGWRLSPVLDQYVECVPAQQRLGPRWYEGTADAINQNLNLISDEEPRDVCVFGGDHVYKMDVREPLLFHRDKQADLTVCAISVPLEEASRFGVIEVDDRQCMIGFEEKPKNPKAIPGQPDRALASMGNYIFKADVLAEEVTRDAVKESSDHDFGKNIISSLVPLGRVFVYDFMDNRVPGATKREHGYWRDLGTIDAYVDAHWDLVSVHPVFNFYNRRWPIRTRDQHDPPAKFVHNAGERVGSATNSIVSDGCIISGGQILQSVLSPRVRIHSFATVERCIVMDSVQIHEHAQLRNCVVDKDVVVPAGLRIGHDEDFDREHFVVSDGGVVVVGKGADLSGLV